jgi:zona occludens toxin (predicted ATPase)
MTLFIDERELLLPNARRLKTMLEAQQIDYPPPYSKKVFAEHRKFRFATHAVMHM